VKDVSGDVRAVRRSEEDEAGSDLDGWVKRKKRTDDQALMEASIWMEGRWTRTLSGSPDLRARSEALEGLLTHRSRDERRPNRAPEAAERRVSE
jgi:hypothetical protein